MIIGEDGMENGQVTILQWTNVGVFLAHSLHSLKGENPQYLPFFTFKSKDFFLFRECGE
jgi:hypothetical protein